MNKFVPNDHLSDEINLNIMQSEKDGGFYIKDLPTGRQLHIKTLNTLYIIERIGEHEYTIRGHNKFCPMPTQFGAIGSTWGGSMIKMGFIGIGMHMEVAIKMSNQFVTTPIQSITLV